MSLQARYVVRAVMIVSFSMKELRLSKTRTSVLLVFFRLLRDFIFFFFEENEIKMNDKFFMVSSLIKAVVETKLEVWLSEAT